MWTRCMTTFGGGRGVRCVSPRGQSPRYVALLFLFRMTACFTPEQKHSVNIRGAGASFPGEVYRIWMTDYRAFRREHRNITISYNEVGSHQGKKMIAEENPRILEYAGSDSPLSEEELDETSDLHMFPTMAGAVVIGYNLPGIMALNLTRELLVGIYNGTFRQWNHREISLVNPKLDLPNKTIAVMARADNAGTTAVFTKALGLFDSNWENQYGMFSNGLDENYKPEKWNSSIITYYGRTTKGITGLLLSVQYSVGYLSKAHAKSAKIKYASVMDKYHAFVEPSTHSVQQAMNSNRFDAKFNYGPYGDEKPGSYPIFSYTYLIIRTKSMSDCKLAVELYGYVHWFMTSEEARYDCIQLSMVPLQDQLRIDIQNSLKIWTCNNGQQNVYELFKEQTKQENIKPMERWKIAMVIIISAVVMLLLILASYLVYQHIRINMAVYRHDWKIELQLNESELTPRKTRLVRMLAKSGSSVVPDSEISMQDLREPVDVTDTGHFLDNRPQKLKTAYYRDQVVSVWPLLLSSNVTTFSFKTQKLILWLRDSVVHNNVTHFYGLTTDDGKLCAVAELCSKGMLRDIIRGNDYNLDDNFKFSLSCDVASGMSFLHHLGVVHGQLSSAVCFIDSRWNVKISHWQYKNLSYSQNNASFNTEYLSSAITAHLHKFSIAPELINDSSFRPTKQCDIYSFSFLVAEIFMRNDPCATMNGGTLNKENSLKESIRPKLNDSVPKKILGLLNQAWSSDPMERPSFASLLKGLEKAKPSSKSVLDCMMEAVDGYIATLEEKVGERTAELANAKANMEVLLLKMLPVEVASALATGKIVEPESFDSVSIFFSDIVGFTTLSSNSTPMQVVAMLNDLYTNFDHVIDQHDVYKVETIGDAYMVISGAPSRNGIGHASEIASMAIDLASTSSRFVIRHFPDQRLQLRVGVHSGPAVAGVVGLKMPRYCLFGDTVNTASRMETTCAPMKIQLSENTKILLDQIGGFSLEERGKVSIKGKGYMTTYWLLGKDGSESMPEEFLRVIKDNEFVN